MPAAGSSSANKQPLTYVCMSTVDDLSYTPSAEERTRDAAQIAATGRRSWKTLKGKGEAVWPPALEAALIEALEKYQPDDTRSTKLFGRFPMRNRFISNYIFDITGKRRTPKQVGSRLQQLRDTCKGKRLLGLISNRNKSPADLEDSQDHSPSPSPSTSVAPKSPSPTHSSTKRIIIDVEILPEPVSWPSTFPVVRVAKDTRGPLNIRLISSLDYDASRASSDSTGAQSSTSSSHETTGPVVTLSSPSVLPPQASFSVFLDGGRSAVHTEVVPLVCCATPLQGCEWMYTTTLVPGYWKTLRSSTDPSRYTIVQDIVPVGCSDGAGIFPTASTSDSNDTGLVFSVVFRFSHTNPITPPTIPSHFLKQPAEFNTKPSRSYSDSTTSTLSPLSSPTSLHLPSPAVYDIDTPDHFQFPQDLWAPVVPYPQFPPQDGNRYFDTMLSSCPQDYSLTVPMISRTNRYAAPASEYVANNPGQRLIENCYSGVPSWSSFAASFPVYPSNYVL
jgi:hypothetical protein